MSKYFLLLMFLPMSSHSQVKDSVIIIEDDREKIFERVEFQAVYKGSQKQWDAFVMEHFVFDKLIPAVRDTIIFDDSLEVRFVVTRGGAINTIQVLYYTLPALEEEFIRIIRLSSGDWRPGMNAARYLNTWHKERIYLHRYIPPNKNNHRKKTIFFHLNDGPIYQAQKK
jgi:hypothetical protein